MVTLSARRHMQRHSIAPPAPGAYDLLILGHNPVAYWTMDSSAVDLTGNGHNATKVGSPTTQATGFQNGDPCSVFDGLTQKWVVPDADALSPATTGIFCMEAWIAPSVVDFPLMEPASNPAGYAPYVYFLGKNAPGQGYAEWVSRMYSKLEGVDWDAQFGVKTPRPNRISGYVNNLSLTPPAPSNLGAGSYFQDPIVVDEWIHYFFIINTVVTSAQYPMGYTKIFKNGQFRGQNSIADYNITPQNGTADMNIGAGGTVSRFKGRMAKVALYDYEPTVSRIQSHYQAVVPVPSGTALIGPTIGSASSATLGRQLRVTVPEGMTIPAGSRLLVKAAHTYTLANSAITDSVGTTYSVLRSTADNAHTIRGEIVSGQLNQAMGPGDIIQLVTAVDTDERVMLVEQMNHIDTAAPLDAADSDGGLNSITPGINTQITNVSPDVMLIGMNVVKGPISDGYIEDTTQPWVPTDRVSVAGPQGLVINSVSQVVNLIGTNRHYRPTLAIPRDWLSFLVSVKAGTPTITPPTIGSANLIEEVGTATGVGSSTTLAVTFTGEGIPAGHTVIAWVGGSYVGSNATAADTAGNTWTVDRAGADVGHTLRGMIFRAPVTTAISPGDILTITWPSAVTNRVAGIGDFAGPLIPTQVDVVNGASGTSAAPSVTATTTNANDLVVSAAMIARPITDDFNSDITWKPLTKVGTDTGTLPISIIPAWKPAGVAQAYTHAPTAPLSAVWVNLFASYKVS